MIRFTFNRDASDGNDTRPDRLSCRYTNDASLADLLEGFKSFCLAMGYNPESWKNVIWEETEVLGPKEKENG